MLDYNKEADGYDVSRGGEARAEAATRTLLDLIPDTVGRLLDVACGTGIVTRRLAAARPGLRVTGADLTPAMVRRATARLPGAIVRADSRRLPFRGGAFGAVTTVWLLHLLDDADDVRAIVAECARVLRPGGVYITTVDKAAAHDVGSDIDVVLAPRPRRPAADAAGTVTGHATRCGLQPVGRSVFRGAGQGRSPRETIADLHRGWFTMLPPGDPRTEEFAARLARLPDQNRPRPDPTFSVRAYRKPAAG
ncbi:class I SAM-dependent methyltransferase [Streptomyces pluripotens]|uniref:Class I SAM-dependent methyltransferase n=1 Tax=Streptomyces pluripotens TaxID=1355015 RepID=A0A221P5H8_9ACTN|nr:MULTISPECIES: class I SAM-dependent methyltransferase [Streptomyces]ARP73191.1 SAM-dependent methyltransferase [Streptomyces pluripotens]ASN27440.1 class I SAM-dependent methyltransferase [Streptomyces pluripotens]KIE28592.1 methyltransferase [Streptomyces sp. MUSC 125]MCH0558031.1 class I SAM-dependent methyltransferase [Streptomyces sp. MUM 16J]